jgi:hypothetical protein
MTSWILIIYISKELWLPFLSFKTEDDCYAYVETMELAPGTKVTCLPGVIEKEKSGAVKRRIK